MNQRLDWSECAHEYACSRERITALVLDAGPTEVAKRVPACPDWTVHDLCAHLAGVPAALVAGEMPQGDTDAWVARQVADRAARTTTSLLDEWAAVSSAFEQLMVSMGGRIAGLLLDAVAHEHDIRHALEQPGARDSRGVVRSMGFTRILIDGDMKRNDTGSIRLLADGAAWEAGDSASSEPGIVLDLDDRPNGTFELFRLFGSRRSRAQVEQYPWVGDWEAAETGLFHMPLPLVDQNE